MMRMPKKKKAPVKHESKKSEHPQEKNLPAKNQAELTDRDLESVTGGCDSTGLQNPLDPQCRLLYY